MKIIGGITIATIVAVILISVGGVVTASAHSLPGDTLYPVKSLIENIQLTLVFDPEARTEIEQKIENKRIQDIEEVLSNGEEVSVSFTGEISNIENGKIIVSNLSVLVDNKTIIESEFQVGDKVIIMGKTLGNGMIQAVHIEIEASVAQNMPTVDPSQMATYMPTIEHWLTETPLPTNWETIIAGFTHTPIVTIQPQITVTLIPTNWETILPYITQTPMPTLWQTIYPQLTITLPSTNPPMDTPNPEHTPIIPTVWQTYIPTDIDLTAIPTDIATYIPRETPTPRPTHEPRITITTIPSETPIELPTIIPPITAIPTGSIP